MFADTTTMKDAPKLQEFMTALAVKLKITKMEDWYAVTSQDVIDNQGLT